MSAASRLLSRSALLEIRDERLYRAEHATFEDYCDARWGWSRGRAYQYMDAAKVVALVSTTVDAGPTNEAQARELVPLLRGDDDAAARAWQEAQEQAAEQGKPVTAAIVREVVAEKRRVTGSVLDDDGAVLLAADEQLILDRTATPANGRVRYDKPQDLPALPVAEAKALSKIIREAVGIAVSAERRVRIAVLESAVLTEARQANARGERVSIAELWKRIADAAPVENDAGPVQDRPLEECIREWRWGWLLDEGLPTERRDNHG